VQLAWRGSPTPPATKGLSVRFTDSSNKSVNIVAGESSFEGGTSAKVADSPPADWQTARVDLWKLFKQPVRIRSMSLGAVAGPGSFDQILFARDEQALEKLNP